MERARLLISGVVQGVGYRASLAWEARARGLAGWVRNLDDGRVEAEVEGPRETIESLIEWCRQGPPSAHVTGVSVEWTAGRGEKGFRIVH